MFAGETKVRREGPERRLTRQPAARVEGRVTLILKIVPRALWHEAEAAGFFSGSPVDRSDGFIHLSTVAQVAETAARHFAGQGELLLVAVEPARLGDALRWEPSRGGALFPHLYGVLPTETVAWAKPLPLGADGQHDFENLLT